MEMISVSSSTLTAIGYDTDTSTMYVEFLKSGRYAYQGVPAEVFEGLLFAGSKGQYFSQFIKNGGYPFYKV